MERTHHQVEQGTEAWLQLRAGRFTASQIKNILMAQTTKGYQDEIKRVAFELYARQRVEDVFQSSYMKRGKELEPEARRIYEATTFNIVKEAGFFAFGEYLGASPDGLIGDSGLIEIKCPKYNTIIDCLIEKKVPRDYDIQMQTQMLCTDRVWCDFVVYYPGLEPSIIRVEKCEVLQHKILIAAEKAFEDAKDIIKIIKK